MKVKVKIRKVGNSLGVLLPREVISGYNEGDELEIEVITKEVEKQQVITNLGSNVITKPITVVPKNNWDF